MSKSLKLTILIKSTFSKNVSEEKYEAFHQIWSWSWRLFTRTCLEIKKIVRQTSCFSYQSLRTSPKNCLNLFISLDLDPGNVHKQNSEQSLKYYLNINAWNCWPFRKDHNRSYISPLLVLSRFPANFMPISG